MPPAVSVGPTTASSDRRRCSTADDDGRSRCSSWATAARGAARSARIPGRAGGGVRRRGRRRPAPRRRGDAGCSSTCDAGRRAAGRRCPAGGERGPLLEPADFDAELLYDAAPFGVGYFVAAWTAAVSLTSRRRRGRRADRHRQVRPRRRAGPAPRRRDRQRRLDAALRAAWTSARPSCRAAERGGVAHHLLDIWPIAQVGRGRRVPGAGPAGDRRDPRPRAGCRSWSAAPGCTCAARWTTSSSRASRRRSAARLYAELDERRAGRRCTPGWPSWTRWPRRRSCPPTAGASSGRWRSSSSPAARSPRRMPGVRLDLRHRPDRPRPRRPGRAGRAAGAPDDGAGLPRRGPRACCRSGCATARPPARPSATPSCWPCLDDAGAVVGDLDEAVEQTSAATRRFVRRQRSWFRRDPRVALARRRRCPTCSTPAACAYPGGMQVAEGARDGERLRRAARPRRRARADPGRWSARCATGTPASAPTACCASCARENDPEAKDMAADAPFFMDYRNADGSRRRDVRQRDSRVSCGTCMPPASLNRMRRWRLAAGSDVCGLAGTETSP